MTYGVEDSDVRTIVTEECNCILLTTVLYPVYNQEESGPIMMYYFVGPLPDLGEITYIRVGGCLLNLRLHPIQDSEAEEFPNSEVRILGCCLVNPARCLILSSGLAYISPSAGIRLGGVGNSDVASP